MDYFRKKRRQSQLSPFSSYKQIDKLYLKGGENTDGKPAKAEKSPQLLPVFHQKNNSHFFYIYYFRRMQILKFF